MGGHFEVCAETVTDCIAAVEGGADRVEICSTLAVGGVTASHALIRAAITAARGLPVYVLLRPRAGDFVYSAAEFDIMCADLDHAAAIGAAGFVAGILTSERAVDKARMSELVKRAAGQEVTFHRAIDHAANLSDALEQAIAAGCKRVLTSGGKADVHEGSDAIVELAHQAGARLRIAAGGGLTPALAAELRRIADVDLHASLRVNVRAMAAIAHSD